MTVAAGPSLSVLGQRSELRACRFPCGGVVRNRDNHVVHASDFRDSHVECTMRTIRSSLRGGTSASGRDSGREKMDPSAEDNGKRRMAGNRHTVYAVFGNYRERVVTKDPRHSRRWLAHGRSPLPSMEKGEQVSSNKGGCGSCTRDNGFQEQRYSNVP